MGTKRENLVQLRQSPLRQQYAKVPTDATIFDSAHTLNACAGDAFHGMVVPSNNYGEALPFGIHRAVGGDHDLPNPGDLLCSALAACLDSSIRMLAAHFDLPLESLQVKVTAEVDVRGCLMVQRDVPVGFQRLLCSVLLTPSGDVDEGQLQGLLTAAENCCVVMQTLRNGVTVQAELAALEQR